MIRAVRIAEVPEQEALLLMDLEQYANQQQEETRDRGPCPSHEGGAGQSDQNSKTAQVRSSPAGEAEAHRHKHDASPRDPGFRWQEGLQENPQVAGDRLGR